MTSKKIKMIKNNFKYVLIAAAMLVLASPAFAKYVPTVPGPVIDKTYAQLSSMATASTLVSGLQYRIMNFRTRHLIPNTADYNTGPTEPLIVTAATSTLLHRQAISQIYPQDIIYYEITDFASTGGDRGRIFFRHDSIKDNSAWFDWRSVKNRRYESTPGSGIYNQYSDPGSAASIDIYTFNNSPTADTCSGNKIESFLVNALIELPNITFGSGARSNFIGRNTGNLAIGTNFITNTWGSDGGDSIVGNGANSNIFGDCVQGLIIGINFRDNVMHSDNKVMTIGMVSVRIHLKISQMVLMSPAVQPDASLE